ncbi:hypothetical protein QL285_094274 [Trifolium repens]|nr:hypothetical protein QL285_094274 [Trifolium repens]
MQTITSLSNASKAAARSLWIRTHSRHLECELLLDERLVHLPDRSQQSSSKGYSPSEDNLEENKEDSNNEGFHEGHSRMAPEPYFGLSNFQSKLQDNVVAVIEDFISSFGILGNSTAVSQSSETSK